MTFQQELFVINFLYVLFAICSDGMSRSGVFITVMSEIDRVKVEGEMDIFHTVKAARTDRPHMVSTVVSSSLYSCTYKIKCSFLLEKF